MEKYFLLICDITACLQPVGRKPPLGQISPLPQGSDTKVNPNPAVSLCFPEIWLCFLFSPKTMLALGEDVVVGVKPWPFLLGPLVLGPPKVGSQAATSSCPAAPWPTAARGGQGCIANRHNSNKWGLGVNAYDLCAFSKPHMNIFLVLKTSL